MEALDYFKFVAALAFVLALMGGLALIMRRLGLGQPLNTNNKRRLKIVETLPVDARRRLVLIQRDDRQHLVILGPSSETVIESGIHDAANKDTV